MAETQSSNKAKGRASGTRKADGDDAGSDAAPIEAPGAPKPVDDTARRLSTSPVAAAASQRSLVGQGHLGLVDDEGSDIDADSIFDFDADPDKTYVETSTRVNERFVQAGSRTPIARLLFPAGARVPRERARMFIDAVKEQAENPLSEAPGRERMNPAAPNEDGAGADSAAAGADGNGDGGSPEQS